MNENKIFNELLQKGNKNQTEIAENEGVSKQYIQKWKKGGAKPNLARLHKIANFLGLKIVIQIIDRD